jgi:hypothetical protein
MSDQDELAALDAQLDGVAEAAEDAYIAEETDHLIGEAVQYYIKTAHLIDLATETLEAGSAVVPDLYPCEKTRDLMLRWMSEADREMCANLIELGKPCLAELILRQSVQFEELMR